MSEYIDPLKAEADKQPINWSISAYDYNKAGPQRATSVEPEHSALRDTLDAKPKPAGSFPPDKASEASEHSNATDDGPGKTTQPLVPNLGAISSHLHALFPPDFVHAYPDAQIEIVYGPPGDLRNSRWFSAFDLKAIAQFAEVRSANGDNCYVGAALRQSPIPEKVRAKTENFLAELHARIEFDGKDDAERIAAILREKKLMPASVITTGTTPWLRQHVYFRIKGGIADAAQLKAVNTVLRDMLGSDDVTDAIRIMRLGGCINYPTEKKQRERG